MRKVFVVHAFKQYSMSILQVILDTCTCTVLSTNDSSNWDVIKHRGRIPVRVQVVVCLLPAPIPCCPKLVQECEYISRIRSKSRIKFRNWDVSYFHFLPGLRFVFLEYLVERLI